MKNDSNKNSTDAAINMQSSADLVEKFGGSRRKFLAKAMGMGAAGAAGMSLLGGQEAAAQATAPSDLAILQFALNLEYLEGEFYSYAFNGSSLAAQGITVTGSGTAGPTTVRSNPRVPFTTNLVLEFAGELYVDEARHVLALRAAISALGGTPIAKPAIDLQNSFNAAAAAAGLGSTFDPFANETNFLLGSYIFEDVGVTAYHGAAPLVQNKSLLSTAAGILAVEAYHAGSIRTQLYQRSQGAATDAISALRKSASGANDDFGVSTGALDIGPNGTSSIVLADNNAIAFSRSTRQVLNIVYLSPGNPTSGGFFPAGLNGPIR